MEVNNRPIKLSVLYFCVHHTEHKVTLDWPIAFENYLRHFNKLLLQAVTCLSIIIFTRAQCTHIRCTQFSAQLEWKMVENFSKISWKKPQKTPSMRALQQIVPERTSFRILFVEFPQRLQKFQWWTTKTLSTRLLEKFCKQLFLQAYMFQPNWKQSMK